MTALPPITEFTDSATTEGVFKTKLGSLRAYLAELFGADGTKKTAQQTLGTLFNKAVSKSAVYTVAATDLGVLLDCTGTWTLTLLAGATAGDGFTFAARNSGTGAITLDPNGSETIDNALTPILQPGTTVILTWDSTAVKWKAQWIRSPNRAIGYATAGGTSDAITATFNPPIPALADGLTVLVRAGAANANTAPTFAPDGLTAKTIVRGANNALILGDIEGAGHWLKLQYDATLDKWVLLNPAKILQGNVIAQSVSAGTAYHQAIPYASMGIVVKTAAQSYTELLNTRILQSGTYRVSFNLFSDSTSYAAYARIYKNGVAVGTVRSNTSLTPVNYTEDLTFAAGDTVQIFAYSYNFGNPYSAYLSELKFGVSGGLVYPPVLSGIGDR